MVLISGLTMGLRQARRSGIYMSILFPGIKGMFVILVAESDGFCPRRQIIGRLRNESPRAESLSHQPGCMPLSCWFPLIYRRIASSCVPPTLSVN